MYSLSYQIEDILTKTKVDFQKNLNLDYSFKSAPEKWSKKEVLGHLVDSAINNTKRFTEAQFSVASYTVVAYSQNELVKINDYQNKNIVELFDLWFHLNKHIAFIIKNITEEKLSIEINLHDFSRCTLEILIQDYISHLKHHLAQIFS
jgi:hypothetical protein